MEVEIPIPLTEEQVMTILMEIGEALPTNSVWGMDKTQYLIQSTMPITEELL